ncbi:MAG: response regulator [Oliverpabstia sp.]
MYEVMIVDDDSLMRCALKHLISKKASFHVCHEAKNGREAINYCKSHQVDIIFMDISMPVMSGLEAGKIISFRYPEIVICIMSAFSEFNYAKIALEMNTKKYLSKPISPADIESFLKEYELKTIRGTFPQMETIVSLVKKEDFSVVNSGIDQIVTEIYEEYGNNYVQMESCFMELGRSVLSTLEEYKDSYDLYEMFPLQKEWLKNKEIVKLWLFQIINFAFQQRSIKRYPLLEQAFLYIEKHIKEDLSLMQITENSNVSQGYLSRIFRKQFGTSVMEYIRIRKIHLAKINLIFTHKSIEDIAYYLGFNEKNYFTKVFRKYEGISIKDYQIKIRS